MLDVFVKWYWIEHGTLDGIEDTEFYQEFGKQGIDKYFRTLKSLSGNLRRGKAMVALAYAVMQSSQKINGTVYSEAFWAYADKDKIEESLSSKELKRLTKEAVSAVTVTGSSKNFVVYNNAWISYKGDMEKLKEEVAGMLCKLASICRDKRVMSPADIIRFLFTPQAKVLFRQAAEWGIPLVGILSVFDVEIPNLYECYQQYGMVFMFINDEIALAFDGNGRISIQPATSVIVGANDKRMNKMVQKAGGF